MILDMELEKQIPFTYDCMVHVGGVLFPAL